MCMGGGIGAGIGAGLQALTGTVASLAGDQASYEQQQRANDIATAQYLAEARSKDLQAQSIYRQVEEEASQVNKQAAADKGEIAKAASARKASQRAAASYAGLAGSTTKRLLSEIGINAAGNISTIESNRENKMVQLTEKKAAAATNAQMQPLYLQDPQQPSFFSALAGVGGALASGLTAAKTYNQQINMYNSK